MRNCVDCVYTSVGCNRSPHALDWSKSGVVCYGGNASVVVYSPEKETVLATLNQHTSRINCVRCVDGGSVEYLVVASTDGLVSVWTVANNQFSLLTKLVGHEGSVVVCCGVVIANTNLLLVASSSSDSTIRLWQVDTDCPNETTQSIYTHNLRTGLALDVHLVNWPLGKTSLFYSNDKSNVNLVAVDVKKEKEWSHLETLPGHEDWVTSLDSIIFEDKSLLLASGGQDSIIRLWRFESFTESKSDDQLQVKEVTIQYPGDVSSQRYSVLLESVLAGHDDKVFCAKWRRAGDGTLNLLSTSLDKTMIVWGDEDGIWMEQARLGEVGGNTLGLFGGAWGPNGQVLGHSFNGALHLWVPQRPEDSATTAWRPGVVPGGHQAPVTDLAWDPSGEFLLSVSSDQTTRCHAPCRRPGEVWHEVARPQVHGYDLACLATLPGLAFVSGAEEKILRAFQAPRMFFDNFTRLTGTVLEVEGGGRDALPQGASLPTLGLSNKAVYEGEKVLSEEERHVKDQFPDYYFTPEEMSQPPAEESLVQNTLWPELHKLYGHGYEVFAVAASPRGDLIASSCKSAVAHEAAILIWRRADWKQIGRIEAHSLTVTQLTFSPCSSMLLSVSRDRTWALHSVKLEDDLLKVEKIKSSDKSSPHKRIIWSCCWTHDSKYFLTCSRDKVVCLWGGENWSLQGAPLHGPESATAVAASQVIPGEYLVCVGYESGEIQVYRWIEADASFNLLQHLNKGESHHGCVKRLQFRPGHPNMLASAAQDHTLKIYKIHTQPSQ